MAPIHPVDDPADPRVAEYVRLTDAALRRGIEQPGEAGVGIFIAEGPLVIRRLLRSAYRVRSFLLTPRRFESMEVDIARVDAPVFVAGPEVMNAITGFDIHRGALAAADRRPLPDPAALLAATGRVGILEGINDHENLGATFRSAAALGIGALLLSPDCCDPLYRRAVRVSMGHVLDVPYARLAPWPGALAEVVRSGYRIVALTPAPSATPIEELGLRSMERVALMLGAEDRGLTAGACERAHVQARIPMVPGADSLNVAAAAAIAFHAAVAPDMRGRRNGG
jgi:tRNA G18 (ribose-2'-O)-methylase SpoU